MKKNQVNWGIVHREQFTIHLPDLAQLDLWGSFAKLFLLSDWLTGTKGNLRSCQLTICIVLNLSKVPSDGIVVSVPASSKIAKDQVPTLVSVLLDFEMCISPSSFELRRSSLNSGLLLAICFSLASYTNTQELEKQHLFI